MFTKAELQIIAATLQQRGAWLSKNIDNPDMSASKVQNQQTLDIIESALAKLGDQFKPLANTSTTANTSTNTNVQSTAQAKPAKLSPVEKRVQMEPEQIRTLIVEDDELMAGLMQALLKSTGMRNVDIAPDGLKGISMLYDANPVYNLVLCDWNMPIKNGLDVHNAMRAAERYADTCFILVTAVTEAKQIRSAIEEGVDDYIVKPIEEQTMLKKLARHFPKIYDSNENS